LSISVKGEIWKPALAKVVGRQSNAVSASRPVV
jgi:hypothetical protein